MDSLSAFGPENGTYLYYCGSLKNLDAVQDKPNFKVLPHARHHKHAAASWIITVIEGDRIVRAAHAVICHAVGATRALRVNEDMLAPARSIHRGHSGYCCKAQPYGTLTNTNARATDRPRQRMQHASTDS